MLNEGETFDRYEVEAVIGRGGMGTVYRAKDTKLGRAVALKVISRPGGTEDGADGACAADEPLRARLLREARAAAALDHPNAVHIFDVGDVDGESFIAMELVRGQSLRGLIGDRGVSLSQKVSMLITVARVLGHAHERGLVHRDIKPENVMVRTDGVVKVLDFGIARRVRTAVDASAPTEVHAEDGLGTLTKIGAQVGTPLYMSPEQIRGSEVGGASDQFAWGVTAYELLTGKMPWTAGGDALQVAAEIVADQPVPLAQAAPGVPPKLAQVVERAMEKSPADRFGSMDALADALDQAFEAEQVLEAGSPGNAGAVPKKLRSDVDVGSAAPSLGQGYTATELELVLKRAIDREAGAAPERHISYDELVDAARELGVNEDALRIAASEIQKGRSIAPVHPSQPAAAGYGWLLGDGPFWTELRKKEARSFLRHLGAYLAVNLGFLVIKGEFVRGVVGIWGAFVIWHAFRVLFPKDKKSKRSNDQKIANTALPGPRIEVNEAKLDSMVEALRETTQRRRIRIKDVPRSTSTEELALEEAEGAPPLQQRVTPDQP